MKLSPLIFALGVMSAAVMAPVEAGPRYTDRFPGERLHLAFVLAQGPGGAQASPPGYTRDRGLLDGEKSAEIEGTQGWFWGGYASGFFLNVIGMKLAPRLAESSDANLPWTQMDHLQDKEKEYVQGFREGFEKRIRVKRMKSTKEGSLWGVLSMGAVVVTVVSGSDLWLTGTYIGAGVAISELFL